MIENQETAGNRGYRKKEVDKRLDDLSTAIYGEQTAADLFQLDSPYIPPYFTPKDPVAILGMVPEKKKNRGIKMTNFWVFHSALMVVLHLSRRI